MKYFLIIAVLLGIGIGAFALAQDSSTTRAIAKGEDEALASSPTTADEAVNLDENVQAADLNVGEPTLLPDSPFYFLKNWAREIQSAFTFNTVKKAELRLKFANEKLVEAQQLSGKTQNSEAIKKAVDNYQQELENIKERVEKIKEKAKDSPQVDKFLDKFIQQQTLQEKILQKLETQVPPEVFEKIKAAREEHLEKFQEVMLKLEDRKEKITEKLNTVLEEQKGSEFKNFKSLEILKNLEEKVPEAAKEAIQKAQENIMNKLGDTLENMSSEDQEKFKSYLEKIGGDKTNQEEILENLKEKLKNKPEIKQKLLEIRDKVLEQVREKVQTTNCPTIEKPAAGFCQEGRIVVKKNEQGCPVSFECVIPAEIEIPEKPATATSNTGACITLWNPVCGKNGKTYSNTCFAKLAGVEVDYKGKCEAKECQADSDCPQPKCGPIGTLTARCTNTQAKCVEGECKIISVTPLVPQTNQ